jgi:hypothetical protein
MELSLNNSEDTCIIWLNVKDKNNGANRAIVIMTGMIADIPLLLRDLFSLIFFPFAKKGLDQIIYMLISLLSNIINIYNTDSLISVLYMVNT